MQCQKRFNTKFKFYLCLCFREILCDVLSKIIVKELNNSTNIVFDPAEIC